MNRKIKFLMASLFVSTVAMPMNYFECFTNKHQSNNFQKGSSINPSTYDNQYIKSLNLSSITKQKDIEFYSKSIWYILSSFLTLFVSSSDVNNINAEEETAKILNISATGANNDTITYNSKIAKFFNAMALPAGADVLNKGLFSQTESTTINVNGKTYNIPLVDFDTISKSNFFLFAPAKLGKITLSNKDEFDNNGENDGVPQFATLIDKDQIKKNKAAYLLKPISSVLDKTTDTKIKTFLDLISAITANVKAVMFSTSIASIKKLGFQLPRLFSQLTGPGTYDTSNSMLDNVGCLFLTNELGISNNLVGLASLVNPMTGMDDHDAAQLLQFGYAYTDGGKFNTTIAETPVMDNLFNQLVLARNNGGSSFDSNFDFSQLINLVGGVGVTFNVLNILYLIDPKKNIQPEHVFDRMFDSIIGIDSKPINLIPNKHNSWGVAAFNINDAYSATYFKSILNPPTAKKSIINSFGYLDGLLNYIHNNPNFKYKDSTIFDNSDIQKNSFLPILMGNLFKMKIDGKSLSIQGNDSIQNSVNKLKDNYDNLLDNSKNINDFFANLKQTSLDYSNLHTQEIAFAENIPTQLSAQGAAKKSVVSLKTEAKNMDESVGAIFDQKLIAIDIPYCTAAFNFLQTTVNLQQTDHFKIYYSGNVPSKNLSSGAIAGIVIGSIAGAALIGTGVFFLGKGQGWWKSQSHTSARDAKTIDRKKVHHDSTSSSARDLS